MLWRTDLPKEFRVPLGLGDLLSWRVEVLDSAGRDAGFRRDLLYLLGHSVSLMFDLVYWTRDQRDRRTPDRPFVLWPFQEDLLKMWEDHLHNASDRGGWDLGHLKSRDMGVTWTFTGWSLWNWRFTRGFEGLLGSKVEDYVDNPSLKSHFGKIRYNLQYFPEWLLPEGFDLRYGGKHIRHMLITNPENGNVLEGEATNPDFGRGGRYSVALIDEFATWDNAEAAWTSLGDTCDFRLVVFTPKGTGHYSYELYEMGRTAFFNIGWWFHPEKGRGVEFDDHGKRTSPWYRQQLDRRTPKEVAQEIDMEFLGSGSPVFDLLILGDFRKLIIDRIKADEYGDFYEFEHIMEESSGHRVKWNQVERDSTTVLQAYLGHSHQGEMGLRIWSDYEPGWDHRYLVSIDVATSTEGGDYTTIDVLDKMTWAQVAQYRGQVQADVAGEIAYDLHLRYGRAFIIPEANSYGAVVIKVLRDFLTYHVTDYMYRAQTHNRRGEKKSDKLGFWTTSVSKPLGISKIKSALRERSIEINSLQTILEMMHFEHENESKMGRMAAKGLWHDDTVIAFMLNLMGLDQAPALKKISPKSEKELDIFRIIAKQGGIQRDNWMTQ